MAPLVQEWMFYETSWRLRTGGPPFPFPWWQQQYFRHWVDYYDGGLFDSKEGSFADNAFYRYWNMVGVKDHHQECLIGQAGEIEPVYDEYSVAFFLFEPGRRVLHLPQLVEPDGGGAQLSQRPDGGHLPIIVTTYRPDVAVELDNTVLATTIGDRQRGLALARLTVTPTGATPPPELWLCVYVSPNAISGFQRRDRTGNPVQDRRINFLQYLPDENRVEVNAIWGPVFDTPPASFGVYGNPDGSYDPQRYVTDNAFHDLVTNGALNGLTSVTDSVAGLCSGVFAWPVRPDPATGVFALDVRLPLDNFNGAADLAELRSTSGDDLEAADRAFWTAKLDGSGMQLSLPPVVAHLVDLYKICRANLLMLSDDGAIHPGPTVYDSFWVRDSSVEGIACTLAGDVGLASRQFGQHYPSVFNLGPGQVGPAQLHGFFGGDHERNDNEWDSNGEALWAIGRFDRLQGPAVGFGAKLYSPYVVDGARWLRDNRSIYGLLFSGWSAEHLGDRDKPHFWDDLWGVAGLYEAARLAERVGAAETGELWNAYASLRDATAASIEWAVNEQHADGQWETFIPTGPADVGRLDSTMIGALAYFHPCRLYMGAKLGGAVDYAARMTIETIWAHFVDGGFRHDAAWNAYGPYLTLQLAHALLLTGDVWRMDQLLGWCVGNAAYAHESRGDGAGQWQVVSGNWSEQHCYPVAKDFAEIPSRFWYMGDIPHGWAAAELILLLRDILVFEADEDGDRHLYLAAGVLPHWVRDGETITVTDAATVFGTPVGYRLTHHATERIVELEITQAPPPDVRYVYPCRFGTVTGVVVDGHPVPTTGADVALPAGTTRALVRYE